MPSSNPIPRSPASRPSASLLRFATLRPLDAPPGTPSQTCCVVGVTDAEVDLVLAAAVAPGREFLLGLAGEAGALTQALCRATRCDRFGVGQFRVGASLVRVLQLEGSPVTGVTESGIEAARLRDAVLGSV